MLKFLGVAFHITGFCLPSFFLEGFDEWPLLQLPTVFIAVAETSVANHHTRNGKNQCMERWLVGFCWSWYQAQS
jgi:hypothetical protein